MRLEVLKKRNDLSQTFCQIYDLRSGVARAAAGWWTAVAWLHRLSCGRYRIWLLADEMGEGDTAGFDAVVRDGVNSVATPIFTQFAIFFSFVGDWPFLTILGFAIFGFLLYIKWKREAVIFFITNVGELILNISLKLIYQHARPEPLFEYSLPDSYSFPSGHALGSFCFFGILAWILSANIESFGNKVAVYTASAFSILSIGLSRVYLGVHYPSDVLAGYLVASVWTLTVIFADRSLRERWEAAEA